MLVLLRRLIFKVSYFFILLDMHGIYILILYYISYYYHIKIYIVTDSYSGEKEILTVCELNPNSSMVVYGT